MDKGNQRKVEIQKTLKHLIHEKGYSSVTMKDISQKMNLSVGGLYYHYHSIQEIFNVLITNETRNVWNIFRDVDSFHGLMESLDQYFAEEKRELLSLTETINGVLYEYCFSFPEKERQSIMKESHDTSIKEMNKFLEKVYRDHERSQRLANHIFLTLHGLNMISMCGSIDENIIDYEFENIRNILKTEYQKENENK